VKQLDQIRHSIIGENWSYKKERRDERGWDNRRWRIQAGSLYDL